MRQTGRKGNIRSLIGFELFIKMACLSFSFPLLSGLSDFCLWAAGYSYVTKENFTEFCLSPCVLLCAALLLTALFLLILFEANAVCLTVRSGMEGGSRSFPDLFFESIGETIGLFQSGRQGRRAVWYCLCFVILVNIPSALFMMFGLSQTGDVAVGRSWFTGILLLGLGLAGIGGLLFSNRRSLLHGILKRGLLLFLAEASVYVTGLIVLIFCVIRTTDSAVSGVFLLRSFERYHFIAGILFASVNTVVFEFFCAEMLMKDLKTKKNGPVQGIQSRFGKKMRRRILWFFCALVLAVTVTQTVSFFRNRSVFLTKALEGVCITAHRGASDSAPENTMAAIALAVEEGADYVEIDVRLTADGVPVLLHDKALFRTTMVLKDVDEVTFEELSLYDAGSSYSEKFAGERVPRLEDALAEFGGKIGFNIELKGRNDRTLVHSVVALIEKYGLEESCVITSASYEQLEWVKELNYGLKTGYILSMAYGDFYGGKAADFFSIRSGQISESIVKKAHARGKEVHAWTVNRENELKRMKAIGVDNIITDKPAYAREVVQRSDIAESLGEWMRLLTSKK